MREYPVPFSTKGDERLLFGLTARECIWVGGGFLLAAATVSIPALIMQLPITKVLYLLPAGLPFLGAGAYIALARVKEYDSRTTIDLYYWRRMKFNRRCRNYIYYRQEIQ